MRLDDLSLKDLLSAIAAKAPTPGGGAVASITAALAAALGQMVVNYSGGKKTLAAHDDLHQTSLANLQRMTQQALELAEADARAYARLNELWKLNPADPRRVRELPTAVDQAIAAPSQIVELAMELLRLLRELAGRTAPSLDSDLAIAAILANAAAESAAWNVHINLPLLEDAQRRAEITAGLAECLNAGRQLTGEIEHACRRT